MPGYDRAMGKSAARIGVDGAKDFNAVVSSGERIWKIVVFVSPAVSASITTWATQFFNPREPWVYWLSALAATNATLMVIVWAKISGLHAQMAKIDPADIAAEKERGRQQIAKWRSMLAQVTDEAIDTGKHVRELFMKHEDFLSLKPFLKERNMFDCEYDRDDVVGMFTDPLADEISRIARERGVEQP